MWIINPIIDTESIGKHIWTRIYQIADKKWVTQTKISERLWVSTPSISFLLTGKKATSNLDQYWRIAEAIPISRSEFDKIVEEAKMKVIWVRDNDSLPFSLHDRIKWLSSEQQKMVDRFIKSISEE